MSQVVEISRAQARRVMLWAQGLGEPWNLGVGSQGAAQAVANLGYVQLDSINVVERAHHHIVWARTHGYRPAQLDDLLTRDRRVFEYWTHAASYLPFEHYRYYLPGMRAFRQRERPRNQFSELADTIELVRARIRTEGPLGAADFEAPQGFRSGWWQRTPAKLALELLFSAGELMVHARRGFQRIYDLSERVLPTGLDLREPTLRERNRFLALEILRTRGLVCDRDLRGWLGRAAFAEQAAELAAEGSAMKVHVEGDEERVYYASAAVIEGACGAPATPRLHILSPFDGLIIWRERIDRLFGFVYRLECYLPRAKRRYGYFCLPVLWGDRFLGRMDAKADRGEGVLRVRQLFVEAEPDSDGWLEPFAAELRAYAAFNDCEHVVLERVVPETRRDAVAAALVSVAPIHL